MRLTPNAWVWSGSNNFGWDDWDAATKDDEAWSDPEALWLPGDPNWGGAEGYIEVIDDTNYIWEFMYKGQLQFILNLGSTKYDLAADPDEIVPDDATVDGGEITWQLDSKYWTKFRYEYRQGSWLADSSIASPDTVSFDLIGTYDDADLGWADNFWVAMGSEGMVIDTIYIVIETDTTYEYVTDTSGISYDPVGAMWDLPAAADWTEWKFTWTNPSTDIGGTLTMILDNDTTAAAEWITLDNMTFTDDHANWTFFDDFVYREAPSAVRSIMVNDLHVYPNPAVDMLYLSLQIPLRKVEMYNVMGQRVKVLQNPDRKFNVSDLASGMYLLHATDEEGMIHEVKFIKK